MEGYDCRLAGRHYRAKSFSRNNIGYDSNSPARLIITNLKLSETTQEDVHQELLAEEKAERRNTDAAPIHETTASTFLTMGMDLEHQQ